MGIKDIFTPMYKLTLVLCVVWGALCGFVLDSLAAVVVCSVIGALIITLICKRIEKRREKENANT